MKFTVIMLRQALTTVSTSTQRKQSFRSRDRSRGVTNEFPRYQRLKYNAVCNW